MSDDRDLADRVRELERTVERLQGTLDRRERTLSLLVANADIDPLSADCPECGSGDLRKESGLSWARIECPSCGTGWYL